MCHLLHHQHPPPEWVPLLQLMNVNWHIINTQSSQFILGFTLGVIYSVGIDTHVVVSTIIVSYRVFSLSVDPGINRTEPRTQKQTYTSSANWFLKHAKGIEWSKDSPFNKWCCSNWSPSRQKQKQLPKTFSLNLTPHTKINSKWILDLNVKSKAITTFIRNRRRKFLELIGRWTLSFSVLEYQTWDSKIF